MAAGVGAELQLALLLEDDDPLLGRALVQQRPHERGLAPAHAAGHQDVEPGPHRGPQQAGDALVVHLPVAHQRVLVGVDEGVAPHRHVGPGRHPRRGGEPRTVGQLQVEQRAGRRELLLDVGGVGVEPEPAALAGQGLDLLDELLVAARHGVDPLLAPVHRAQPDVVAADHEDVGDVAPEQVGLEPGKLREQPGEHRLDDAVLLLGRVGHLAALLGGPPLAVELAAQDRPGHLPAVDRVERGQALLLAPGRLLADLARRRCGGTGRCGRRSSPAPRWRSSRAPPR